MANVDLNVKKKNIHSLFFGTSQLTDLENILFNFTLNRIVRCEKT